MFSQSTPSSKRKLDFGSPSTPKTPAGTPETPDTKKTKSSVKPSIVGVLVMIGVNQVGKTHRWFDVKVQVGANRYRNLRVMLMGTVPDMEQYLDVPARFTLSSKDSGDMIFFNAKYGSTVEPIQHQLPFAPLVPITTPLQDLTEEKNDNITIMGTLFWTSPPDQNHKGARFRNGIISDKTNSVRITVWRLYDSLKNGTLYKFSDMNTKKRKFLTVENTIETIIMPMPLPDEPLPQPDLKPYLMNEDTNKIDNVRIINIKTKVSKMCNSGTCNENLGEIDANEKFVRCPNKGCLSLMRQSDLANEYSGELTVVDDDTTIVLNLSHQMIVDFGYGQELQTLEMDLMSASNLTLIYNEISKSVVLLCPNDNNMDTEDPPANELDDQSLALHFDKNSAVIDGDKDSNKEP